MTPRLFSTTGVLLLASCGSAPAPDPQVRVHRDIVNIVEPALEQDLQQFLRSGSDPGRIARAFYDAFEPSHDFLFLITDDYSDDRVPELDVAGRHLAVHRPSIPGTGIDTDTQLPGHDGWPRLKSVIGLRGGMTFGFGVMGPYAHELTHHWANFLDPALGLGGSPSHFNAAIAGILGADGALYCMKPQGAELGQCEAEANGRFLVYEPLQPPLPRLAPLELYLMGLIPASEVPPAFYVEQGAVPAENPDPERYAQVLEVEGFESIAFADVLARHGERALTPASERRLSVAFALVTAAPASDALMDATAEVVEVFVNRRPAPFDFFPSFESLTGGRVTLELELRPRHGR